MTFTNAMHKINSILLSLTVSCLTKFNHTTSYLLAYWHIYLLNWLPIYLLTIIGNKQVIKIWFHQSLGKGITYQTLIIITFLKVLNFFHVWLVSLFSILFDKIFISLKGQNWAHAQLMTHLLHTIIFQTPMNKKLWTLNPLPSNHRDIIYQILY